MDRGVRINLFPYASKNAIGNVIRIDNQIIAEYENGSKLISPIKCFPSVFIEQIPSITWGSRKLDNSKMMEFYFSNKKLKDFL